MKMKLLIPEINKIIKDRYPGLIGTYFFGSRNKNKHNEGSDYDILLSFRENLNWQDKNTIYDLIAEIELTEGIVIDVKLLNEKELKTIWTPFRENVIKEGTFYAAGKI